MASLLDIPHYLVYSTEYNLVVCSEHNTALFQDSLEGHLLRKHSISKKNRLALLERLESLGLRASYLPQGRLPDFIEPILGLKVQNGFRCGLTPCRFISIHRDPLLSHIRYIHGPRGLSRGRKSSSSSLEPLDYSRVSIQTLLSSKTGIDYFIVNTPSLELGTPLSTSYIGPSSSLVSEYTRFHQKRQETQLEIATSFDISESSTWHSITQIKAHLLGLDFSLFPALLAIPNRSSELDLVTICLSLDLVLDKAFSLLERDDSLESRLSTQQLFILNDLTGNGTSVDPIKALQNSKSRQKYKETWKRMICYFARTYSFTDPQNTLKKTLFQPTKKTLRTWRQVLEVFEISAQTDANSAQELEASASDLSLEALSSDSDSLTTSQHKDKRTSPSDSARQEASIFRFCMSLLQQSISEREYASPILSFIALSSFNPSIKAWRYISEVTSILSQLIYTGQVLTALYSLKKARKTSLRDMDKILTSTRDRWLLNKTSTPIGVIQRWRLYGMAIGRQEAIGDVIRWDLEEKIIFYKDIQLSMAQLQNLAQNQLEKATSLFFNGLLCNLDPPKPLDLLDLVDNWAERSSGYSFIQEPQNQDVLLSKSSWLINKINVMPVLRREFFSYQNDLQTVSISPQAVKLYEVKVQSFLKALFTLIHLTSGQPARSTEIRGLRWQNSPLAPRNILLHRGMVVFILSYHKAQNLTGFSRFPVRVLFPAVARLLIDYLVYVRPFLEWLWHKSMLDSTQNHFLWLKKGQIWPLQDLSTVFEISTQSAIGIRLNFKSWRQIAVGIGMKKLGVIGQKMAEEIDLENGEFEEISTFNPQPSLPEAFHWQAGHTPATAALNYGGTINFSRGLTTEGLEQFIKLSKAWHSLFSSVFYRTDSNLKLQTRKRYRSDSLALATHRAENRVQNRPFTTKIRQNWSNTEVLFALKQVYGPNAQFKSLDQEKAIQIATTGLSPLLVVLGTGQGKSLIYIILSLLPDSGISILVLPLVALRTDTAQKCQKLNLRVLEWPLEKSPTLDNSLILVSVEQALSLEFSSFLDSISQSQRLGRVIIDETHLVFTAEAYRKSLAKLRELRRVKTQHIFLTATLPPSLESEFNSRLLLESPVVVRAPTVRLDIEYNVLDLEDPLFRGKTVQEIIELKLGSINLRNDPMARVIIYCPTKAYAERLALKLDALLYHSTSGTLEQKIRVLEQFYNGFRSVIVATSALGAGVDYPSIRLIIHMGIPENPIDFTQEIGRAGRDGKGASSFILPLSKVPQQNQTDPVILDYIGRPICRVNVLSIYLDGREWYCEQNRRFLCDLCIKRSQIQTPEPRPIYLLENTDSRRYSSQNLVLLGERYEEGPEILRKIKKEEALTLELYTQALDCFSITCLICFSFDSTLWQGHDFEDCKSLEKEEFFKERKLLGCFLAPYSACFTCGVSQDICNRRSSGECDFPDLLIPLAWKIYREKELQEFLEERDLEILKKSKDSLTWLRTLGKKISYLENESSLLERALSSVLVALLRLFPSLEVEEDEEE